MIRKVVGSLVDAAEQALAANRNQRVSLRQLASSAVASRPLKRSVMLLLSNSLCANAA